MKKFASILILIALLSGGLSTMNAQEGPDYDFPIATHYPAPGGGEGAPYVIQNRRYGLYNHRTTDYYAPSRSKVLATIGAIQVATGKGVASYNAFHRAEEDVDKVQIVNNVAINGALYTIFLPPGWTRDSALPIVLSGNGAGTSNNSQLYGGRSGALGAILAAEHNVIAAYSNCGGTESQGVDVETLHSVGAFFAFMGKNGGDPSNAVTAGGSRGGGTALVWAANPFDLDYDVKAVFAVVPPVAYGWLSSVSIQTYPSLGSIYELVAGEGMDRYDQMEKTEGGLPDGVAILFGAGTVQGANRISAYNLAERLRGKTIFLSEGTHDAYFPLWTYLAFDRRLDELDIPHTTEIVLGAGHNAQTYNVYDFLQGYLESLGTGEPFEMPEGRLYVIDREPGRGKWQSLDEFLGREVTELPFTVEIPYYAGAGLPIDVALCGAVGKAWSISATGPDGAVAWEAAGVFGEGDPDDPWVPECAVFQMDAPDEPGKYVWAFTYDGEEIPNTHTTARNSVGCGIPAVTMVTAQQPSRRAYYAGSRSISFGIDQFIHEAEGCE
jgi:hypothetical protein